MKVGRGLVPGVALVACTLLGGCGSDSGGIPEDASTPTFCKASDTFSKATRFDDGVKAAKKLHDTGTPKKIPGDARDGFELVVQLVTDAKDQADLETRYKKLSTRQKASIQKLDAYISKTC